jgi:hypothetical protein
VDDWLNLQVEMEDDEKDHLVSRWHHGTAASSCRRAGWLRRGTPPCRPALPSQAPLRAHPRPPIPPAAPQVMLALKYDSEGIERSFNTQLQQRRRSKGAAAAAGASKRA